MLLSLALAVTVTFDSAVTAATATLQAKGWVVTASPASTTDLSWSPALDGTRLVVEDRSRTVAETVPYAGSVAGPPAQKPPQQVHPRATLWLFPASRLSATRDNIRRDQPGDLSGALAGALLFTLQQPQSLDQDQAFHKTVLEALFPGDADQGLAKREGAPPASPPKRVRHARAAYYFESSDGRYVTVTVVPF